MTRPRKRTVDWFPHSVNHGRTIFVLERRWGIAGYAFWFKLLELMGNSEGHFIDADNKSSMDYLQALTYTDKDTCLEILNQLADLDAIDLKLWKEKIIWSDNFVAGLAALYRNRNLPLPDRPVNYRKLTGSSGVSNAFNPIREEVKEGKEVERKDIAPSGPVDHAGAPQQFFYTCPYFEVDFNYRFKLAKEYPALPDDLLLKELSRMEDWITDNPKKRKFKSNGHLANPRLFIKNWLDRVKVSGDALFPGKPEPKIFDTIRDARRRRENGVK